MCAVAKGINRWQAGVLWCVPALLFVIALGGCGQNDPLGKKPRTVVRMWVFPMLPELRDQKLYDELVRRFSLEHPEIDVRVETIPWLGRTQKILTAIAGGTAPDAVYMNLDLIPQMVSVGAFRPVDDFITPEDRADYFPMVADALLYEGKTWMFPMLRSVSAALYNVDIFKKAGLDPDKPPTTWDEIELMAAATTKDTNGDGHIDQWGFGIPFGGDSLNATFWPLLWQAGGEPFSADGRHPSFNTQAGIDALSFLVRLFKSGAVPHSFLSLGGNEFAQGKLAYWFGTGSVEPTSLLRDAPKLNFRVAPILRHKERAGYSSNAGYSVFSTCKNPEATALWLKFMTRTDNMVYFCKGTNFFPMRKSAGKIYHGDPIMGKLEDELQYTRVEVKNVRIREVARLIIAEIQSAVLGQKSPDQALNDAAAKTAGILDRAQ